MDEHYRTLSAIFPIILDTNGSNTRILLHRRQNTGYQDGKWDIAGSGHVDEGETARTAVIRECREELGIDVKENDLTFIHLSHRFSVRTYYDIYFIVNKYSGEPSIMEPEKNSELSWFKVDELPNDMIACRKAAVLNYMDNIYYSECLEDAAELDTLVEDEKDE